MKTTGIYTWMLACIALMFGVSTAKADNGEFDPYFTTLPKEEGKGVVTTLCYSEEGGLNIYMGFNEEPGTYAGMVTWTRFNNPWEANARVWIECVDAEEGLYILAGQGRFFNGIIDNGDGTGVSLTGNPGDKETAMRFKIIEKRDAQGELTGYSFQTADGKWYITGANNRLNNLNFLSTTVTDETGNTAPREVNGEWKIGNWKGVGFIRLRLFMWDTPASGGNPQPDENGFYYAAICYPFDLQVPNGNCFSDGTPVPEMTRGAKDISVWTVGDTYETDGSIKLTKLNSGDIVKAGKMTIVRAKDYDVELLIPMGANYAATPDADGITSGYYTQLYSGKDFHLSWHTKRFSRPTGWVRGKHENISYSGYGENVKYTSDEIIYDEYDLSFIRPNIGYIVTNESNADIQEYSIDFEEGVIKGHAKNRFDTYFTSLPKEEGKGVVTTLTYKEGTDTRCLGFINAPGSALGKSTWAAIGYIPRGVEGKVWLECVDATNSLYVLAAQGRYFSGVTDNGDGTGVAQTSTTGDRTAAMRFKVTEKETTDGISDYSFVTEDGKWYMQVAQNRVNSLNFLSTTTVDSEGNIIPREENGVWQIGTEYSRFVSLTALRSWQSASWAGCPTDTDGYYYGAYCLPFAVMMPDGNNYADGTPVPYMTEGATQGMVWVVEDTPTAEGYWKLKSLQPGDVAEAGEVILIRQPQEKINEIELLVNPDSEYADTPKQNGLLTGYYTEPPLQEAFHFEFVTNGVYTPKFVRSQIQPNEVYGPITYSGYGKSVVAHADVTGGTEGGCTKVNTNLCYILPDKENADIQEYSIDFEAGLIKPVDTNGIEKTDDGAQGVRIHTAGNTLTCTCPDATKIEVYTPQAVKVGEAAFHDGEAVVTLPQTLGIYLYTVTYLDGRKVSGKALASHK